MKIINVLIAIVFGGSPLFTVAQSVDDQAMDAFSAALADLTHREVLSENRHFAYTQGVEDGNGSFVLRRFQSSANNTKWEVLESKGEDLIDLQIDWNVPQRLTGSTLETLTPTYCDQSEGYWVFCAKAPVTVDMDDEAQAQQANQMVQEGLATQIWIDKQQLSFAKMTISNQQTLHPSPLARVDRFEIVLEFSPAWPQGPLVTTKASRRLEGKYGFFISIDEYLVQTMTDIEPLNSSIGGVDIQQ